MALPRKHARRTLSCQSCRRKKRKCDRQLPCSNCTKVGLGKTCKYEDVQEQLPIKNGEPENDWKFNMHQALNTSKEGVYKFFTQRHMLNHVSMVSGDPALWLIYHFICSGNINPGSFTLVSSRRQVLSKEVVDQLDETSIALFGPSYVPPVPSRPTFEDLRKAREAISQSRLIPSLIFHQDLSWPLLPSARQALLMLPSYEVVMMYVNIYFEQQNHILPVINKRKFFHDLHHTLEQGVDHLCRLRSSLRPSDISTMSCLLLMMRIAFTALRESNLGFISEQRKLVEQHPIPVDIVEVAELLCNESVAFCGPNISTAQALTLLYIYRTCSPEFRDHDSGEPYQILSLAVSNAKCYNLKMSTSLLVRWQAQQGDDLQISARRQLWFSLLFLELQHAAVFGETLEADPSNSCLEEIFSEDHGSDDDLFFQTMRPYMPILTLVRDLILISLHKGTESSYNEISAEAQKLEDLVNTQLLKPQDYLSSVGGQDSEESTQKCFKFRIFLLSKLFLVAFHRSCALFFEKLDETARCAYHHHKELQITHKEFSFIQKGLICTFDLYFGEGALFFFNNIFLACVRLQVKMGDIRVRLKCTLKCDHGDTADLNYMRRVKLIESCILNLRYFEERQVDMLEWQSRRSMCAFSSLRMCRFGQRIVENEQLYIFKPSLAEEASLHLSLSDIANLDQIFNESRIEISLFDELYKQMHLSVEEAQKQTEEPLHSMEALQLDKMWLLLKMIQAHTKDMIFSSRMGCKAPETEDEGLPDNLWHLEMDSLQFDVTSFYDLLGKEFFL